MYLGGGWVGGSGPGYYSPMMSRERPLVDRMGGGVDRMGPIERMGGMVGGYGRYGPYPGRGGMAGRPHRPFTDHAGGPGAYLTLFNVKK